MIDVSALNFSYPGAHSPTLSNLTFSAPAGQVLGFVGPSGAGKSTTQKVLTGQLQPTSGQVEILGKTVARWGRDLYRQIGISFELPTHFLRLTGRENLAFFGALYGVDASVGQALMERLGLGDAADQRVENYSKGMKTRLGLVRALLHDPQVLFLDEPGGGLDPSSVAQVEAIISEQRAAGKTIFLTTHDMLTVDRLCDQVAFLIDGTLPVIGDPQALKLAHGNAEVRVQLDDGIEPEQASFPLSDLGSNQKFLTLIQQRPVRTIHTQEADLSQIFQQLTGAAID